MAWGQFSAQVFDHEDAIRHVIIYNEVMLSVKNIIAETGAHNTARGKGCVCDSPRHSIYFRFCLLIFIPEQCTSWMVGHYPYLVFLSPSDSGGSVLNRLEQRAPTKIELLEISICLKNGYGRHGSLCRDSDNYGGGGGRYTLCVCPAM